MRLLLLLLIILNVLYAGWEYLNPVRTDVYIVPMADNLQSLELLQSKRIETTPVENDRSQVEHVAGSDETGEGMAEEKALLDEQDASDVVSVKARACYTLGPFKDKGIMQQLRESLAEHVKDISVRKRQEAEKHRYWVYVPVLKSRKLARKTADKLRENNIKDFYIVLSGTSRNSVSLGHYREPVHANRRVKQINDLGIDAEIKVLYRDYDVYWLDYEENTDRLAPEFSIDEYMTEGVSRIIRECDGQ